MESVQIQPPNFTFRALNNQWKLDCFPIPGNSVICIDQLGHSSLVNVPLRYGATMPRLHNPKRMPIFIGIHKPDPSVRGLCHQKPHNDNIQQNLEVPTTSSAPYVREPKYYSRGSCPEISSYGCLTGAQVCISVDGVGTYCMDTQNHTWTRKVDYVPELKLWLGFSAKNRHLAAADLSGVSTMNSQPQLMDLGKEFDT
ncbi:hypothetical protein PR202_gb21648 [Eleusine coracana subsp. coracana]|uniref:Uncharacterized protein n=1 Tax=Eleusine coracana subsp. coracana TaxID=191504 RepID=A0AAV5FFA3_ELECO|nr:hypothetical protein PR202_gb21648 [Eleusine coracana subsp. coracana]